MKSASLKVELALELEFEPRASRIGMPLAPALEYWISDHALVNQPEARLLILVMLLIAPRPNSHVPHFNSTATINVTRPR